MYCYVGVSEGVLQLYCYVGVSEGVLELYCYVGVSEGAPQPVWADHAPQRDEGDAARPPQPAAVQPRLLGPPHRLPAPRRHTQSSHQQATIVQKYNNVQPCVQLRIYQFPRVLLYTLQFPNQWRKHWIIFKFLLFYWFCYFDNFFVKFNSFIPTIKSREKTFKLAKIRQKDNSFPSRHKNLHSQRKCPPRGEWGNPFAAKKM